MRIAYSTRRTLGTIISTSNHLLTYLLHSAVKLSRGRYVPYGTGKGI